ncbi:MAG: hypothetical protein HQL77_08500 [Magnetococcales bacterium]|nr:hypothetical protein [Magnetococcales bacterium]
MIEDVTLTREKEVAVQIRFWGGAIRLWTLARAKNAWQLRQTRMKVLKSLAMNRGPLSEMVRGRASGCCSLARWMMISISKLKL